MLETKTSPPTWVARYADALFNYAIMRISDRETARDMVQDTFLAALRGTTSFRGDSSEKTWLFSILKNKIIDHYRKNAAENVVPLSEDDAGHDYYFGEDGGWKDTTKPSDWSASGQDEYRSKEFFDTLQRCLSKLTAQCRAVFSLKYLDELESDEICKELSVSPSNYWVIMHRAKLVLRHCIEKNWIHS